MKKKICSLILLCSVHISLFAQHRQVPYILSQFNVNLPNNSNNIFFVNHPKFCQVEVRYDNYKPAEVFFYRKIDSSEYKNYLTQFFIEESYDLGFVGDAYLLASRYKEIRFFETPDTVINKIAGLPKCPQGASIGLSAFIYKDTVQYQFRQQCDTYGSGVRFVFVNGIGIPPLPTYYNYRTGDTALKKH